MTDMIEKIAALRAKIPENGATEEEAMAALAIAEKLMEKHGITEADLKAVEFSRDMRQGEFEQKQKQEHPSQKYCDTTIARYCGTKAWNGRSQTVRGKKTTEIFGFDGDVAMHEFLLGLIHDSMNRGWKEFLKLNVKTDQSRHTQYWSFMIGFAERINEKIDQLIEARVAQVDSTGNDLVEVKEVIVEQGMEAMLPSMKFRKQTAGRNKVNLDAYGQGKVAGDKVNLQRPLDKKTSNVKRIT